MNGGETGLNRFVRQLREACGGERVLREKWLLAPTRRVGFQWTEQVARSGRPVVNVRVKTLPGAALGIASPRLAGRGAGYLRGAEEEVLLARVFAALGATGSRYLGSLQPGPGTTRVLGGSIRDLRLAGVRPGDLNARDFEVQGKGLDMAFLLAEYERRLREGRFFDYADLLLAAAERLGADPRCLPEGVLILAPEQMVAEFKGLERRFWEAVPPEARRTLGEDRPGELPEGNACDAALLAWVEDPAGAPMPARDGTASLYRAVGEANEVREVFRRCAEEGIPLDRAEILYTDRDTYVPLIYERAWNLGARDHDSVPVTFAEGVSPRTSRPGRALAGWLAWIREGFPQSVLTWMLRDGLFLLPEAREEAGWSPAGLAEVFRTLPVEAGRWRYLPVLDAGIRGLARELEGEAGGSGAAGAAGEERDEAPSPERRREALARRLHALGALRDLVSDLLLWAPAPGRGAGQKAWLDGTALFLERRARRADKFDEYCHEQLLKEIRGLSGCLGEEPVPGLDVPLWLADLASTSRVGGLGPRPGCLHAAPLHAGGHAGRGHTFIVGLDDQRFPGAGLQDPLLLDAERLRISGELPTAAARGEKRAGDLARLLARLRGRVALGYSCRSLADDRDAFPSPLLLAAYRILSGNREGVLQDMLRDLPPPVSFAPESPRRCLDTAEWWLWRTSAGEPLAEPEQVVSGRFPHLGRGIAARRARESDRFTEYDGYVPEAAAEADPTRPDGPVVSASRLERLGQCPLDYFFRYLLGIEPLEEAPADPQVWLSPMESGDLLHEAFRRYMARLFAGAGPDARFRVDETLMAGILQEEIDRWKARKPPAGREGFERQVRELRQTARIFLLDEAEFCAASLPRFFEVSVGLPPAGEGSALDSPDPVAVRLPGGASLSVRGRIDRVDAVAGVEPAGDGRPRFSVWDYKTGSTWKYKKGKTEKNPDPFDQGRVVQNYLYTVLARARLREALSPLAVVDRFGYFFPSERAHGERISWTPRELETGPEVLARLCRLPATGCFPLATVDDDIQHSPYRPAYGDAAEALAAASRKLANPDNRALEPFRSLRGASAPGGGEEEAEEEGA